MAKWITQSGTKVVILMCTNGNKGTGDRSFTPESLAATREIEQQNAAKVLGVAEVVFLRLRRRRAGGHLTSIAARWCGKFAGTSRRLSLASTPTA